MKAGLAVNLAVARALHRSGVRTERRLALHSVVSEEDGGLGALATVRGHTGDVAVITEPTSGRVVTANAGALTFRPSRSPGVRRTAAPGSTASRRSRRSGRCTGPAGVEARRTPFTSTPLAATRRRPTASRSARASGDWASSVPDSSSPRGRMGVRQEGGPPPARALSEEAVARTRDATPACCATTCRST